MSTTRARQPDRPGSSEGPNESERKTSPVVAVALVYLVMAILVGAGWIAAAVPLR